MEIKYIDVGKALLIFISWPLKSEINHLFTVIKIVELTVFGSKLMLCWINVVFPLQPCCTGADYQPDPQKLHSNKLATILHDLLNAHLH